MATERLSQAQRRVLERLATGEALARVSGKYGGDAWRETGEPVSVATTQALYGRGLIVQRRHTDDPWYMTRWELTATGRAVAATRRQGDERSRDV